MNVEVYLKSKESFVNRFNDKELNSELGDYIFNKALISKLIKKQGLKIKICTNFEVAEEEKESMLDMIRSYYGHLIKTELIYLKINYIKSLILFLVGIVLLSLAYVSEFVTKFVLPEILVIIGWLAIWEAANAILLSNTNHNKKIKILKNLTTCYVEIESKK